MYFVFRAQSLCEVSQLELEVQGEVDKYAAALFGFAGPAQGGLGFGNGVHLVAEVVRARELLARSRAVRARLFGDVEFVDGEGTDAGERYRAAHQIAARYVRGLEAEHLTRGDVSGLASGLRRFYRAGLDGKRRLAGGYAGG